MTPPMTPDPMESFDATSHSAQAPRRSASTMQLTLVSVAVLAGAAGTFGFLTTHPSASPRAAAPVSAPVAASAHSTASSGVHVSAARRSRWSRENEYRWIANHKRSVAYELAASQQVKAWNTHVQPTLVVRCLNRKTEVFVFTETPAKLESGDGMHTVKLTFDHDAEADERWPDSQEHDALFAPDGTELARRLSTAHELGFGFTPHNADPVHVSFDLGDASRVVSQVAKTCGWKTAPAGR